MITLTLEEREQQALGALVDMALRGSGIAAHEPAGIIMQAMAAAKAAADAEASNKVAQIKAAE